MDQLKEWMNPALIWFLVGVFLLLLEFALPGLVVLFFGIGAMVVSVVCVFADISINVQLLIFIVASLVSLVVLRGWLKGVFIGHVKGEQSGTAELEEFVGKRAVVKQRIVPKLGGKVEFHGTDWRAEADEEVAEGTVVEILSKDNLTLKVKAI